MIVGQMSMFRFPLWEKCLSSLASMVDGLYLRFDGVVGDKEILNNLDRVCGNKLKDVYVSKVPWGANGIWREEMLRMLDSVKPELVLSLDEDEEFGEGIERDIRRFRKGKTPQMAFAFKHPMPTIDGFMWKDKPLPSKPQVKLYKWREGLTFLPYKRRGRLSNHRKDNYSVGMSQMLHYCFWDEGIRSIKLRNSKIKEKWIKKQRKEK